MDILGHAPDWGRVEEVLSWFPDFEGDVPDEAVFWERGDLELYFGTQGQLWPLRKAGPEKNPTCVLLSHLRQVLAEWGISKATPEYRSLCRHRAERADVRQLPSAAECTEVQRLRRAPEQLREPVVLEDLQEWRGRGWDMDFWFNECGGEEWTCRARSPPFERDGEHGAQCTYHNAFVWEYVEYVRVIDRMDPGCARENEIAFPRVILDNWQPFTNSAWEFFELCWKELALPGVRDLSPRWMRRFGDVGFDWMEYLARLYTVSIAAVGATTRLCKENHGAHKWFFQTEGKRLFFLFPPEDGRQLSPETGGPVPRREGYCAAASPVDVFYPAKRHAEDFGKARARAALLLPGEALVVPAGWWHCSAALESSVTLQHRFWNLQNKRGLVEQVREFFDWESMPPDRAALWRSDLESIHAEVMEDEASDEEN